ncbi:hypothetical protein [Paenibacillus taichungensis]
MDNYIYEIWKSLKKHKWLYIIFSIIIGLYLIKTKQYLIYEIIISTALLSYEMITENMVPMLFLLVLVIICYILLKVSDTEFKKLLERHYSDYNKWDSKDVYPIKTRVIEDNSGSESIREVVIYNELKDSIETIKGKIDFYNDRKRVFYVPFEISDLDVHRSERVYHDSIKKSEYSWDEFSIKIEFIKAGEYEKENLKLFGVKFYRTHFLIFNKFNYLRIFGRKILPFEISWLKEKWFRSILPRIKWHFRLRTLYSIGKTLPTKDFIKDVLKNLLRIVISLPFILVILWFIIMTFIEMANFIYNLVELWIMSFVEIIVIVF